MRRSRAAPSRQARAWPPPPAQRRRLPEAAEQRAAAAKSYGIARAFSVDVPASGAAARARRKSAAARCL